MKSLNNTILLDSVKPVASNTLTEVSEFSIFKNHELKLVHQKLDPILHFNSQEHWPALLLFGLLALYVYIKNVDSGKIIKIGLSVFSLQASKQLYREDYKLSKRVSVFLSLCFILVISFLIYSLNKRFDLILNNVNSVYQYLFFSILVVLMYSVKISLNYILSSIFHQIDLAKEYTFNIFVFSQLAGLLLFPFALFIQFSQFPKEWFLYPCIILVFSTLILRLYRGIVISTIEGNVGFLYILLYLCALEVLPLLILIKFLVINF